MQGEDFFLRKRIKLRNKVRTRRAL